jgi:hypothetical protein
VTQECLQCNVIKRVQFRVIVCVNQEWKVIEMCLRNDHKRIQTCVPPTHLIVPQYRSAIGFVVIFCNFSVLPLLDGSAESSSFSIQHQLSLLPHYATLYHFIPHYSTIYHITSYLIQTVIRLLLLLSRRPRLSCVIQFNGLDVKVERGRCSLLPFVVPIEVGGHVGIKQGVAVARLQVTLWLNWEKMLWCKADAD